MTVLQNYYHDKDEYRRGEIDLCLQKNVDNPYISKIILIVETEARPSIESDKIEIVEWRRRPTYTDCFQIANEQCGDGEIVAICNSDIYFNHTISLAFNITDDECYALSRWDDIHGQLKPFHHSDSQDVWIMRTPIKMVETDFTLGKPGCCSADSLIKYRRIGETSCFGETTLESFFYEFGCNSGDKFYLKSWNTETNDWVWNEVKLVIESGVKEVWRLGLQNDMFIDATPDHRILVDGEFVPLENIDLLQNVMTVNGESKVDLIRSVGEVMTYDITMEAPLSNFECNGIFVHNCDNRIAFILNEAGYKLTNPCKSIYALHIHGHGKHNYTAADRVAPPYLRVNPQ